MDFFSLSIGMAKGRVKAMAREKMVSLALDICNTDYSRFVNEKFSFYKSAKITKTRDYNIKSAVRAAENIKKTNSSLENDSAIGFLRNLKKFEKNSKGITKQPKEFNVHLDKLDKKVFLKSQFELTKDGRFKLEDLLRDPEILKKCPEKIKNLHVTNEDLEYYKFFVDGKFDRKTFTEIYKNEYKISKIEKRLNQLADAGLIKKEENLFFITDKFEGEILELNKSFTRNDLILEKLKEVGFSPDNLREKYGKKDFLNFSKAIKNGENKGYIKNNSLTEKYFTEKAEYTRNKLLVSQEYLENKLNFLKNTGLLNFNAKNETFYVTNIFLEKYNAASSITKLEDDFFKKKILDSFGSSENIEILRENFTKNHLNPDILEKIFYEKLVILEDEGILKIKNSKVFKLEKDLQNFKKDKDFAFGWSDIKILRRFTDDKLSDLEYLRMKPYEKGRFLKLHYHSFLEYEEGIYNITPKGLNAKNDFLKNIKIENQIENFKMNNFSKHIFEKNSFTMKDLYLDKKVLDMFNYKKPNFEFSKYDAKIIFGDFQSGNLNLEKYKETLEKKFKTPEALEKEFKIRSGRIEKLLTHGFLEKTDNNEIRITDIGEKARRDLMGFSFTSYDADVLFKNIEKSGNFLTVEKLNEIVSNELKGEELINTVAYQWKRLSKNYDKNYVGFDPLEKAYFLNEKSHTKLDDFYLSNYSYAVEEIDKRLDYLKHLGFIEENNGNFIVTDRFKNRVTLENFKVSNLDKNLFSKMSENGLNLNEEIEKIKEKFSENEKEMLRQKNIISTRLDKLNKLGLVYENNQIYKANASFEDLIKDDKRMKSISLKEKEKIKKEIDNKVKITEFTFKNIAEPIKDKEIKLWSEENFINFYGEPANSKIPSIKKHLENLEKSGFAMKKENGFLIHDEIFERLELKRLNKDFYTTKQVQVMKDLSKFLNMTENQAVSQIFGNEEIAKHSLNELVAKNVIDFIVKQVDNENQKVYYLKSAGKKEIIKITGEDLKIYDSKIHKRPQEVEHDLYVYSAFKDFEKGLTERGCRITKVMTDKDIRAFLNKGESSKSLGTDHKYGTKVEFADLYIEYEDLKTKELGFSNVEVDVGYTKEIIKSKSQKIENLNWYTNSENQKKLIKSVTPKSTVKVIPLR